MQKATLRTSKPGNAAPTIDVDATVVESPAPGGDLANMVGDGAENAAPASTAVTRRPNTSVGRPSLGLDGSGLEGDWSQDDVKFPTLKQVQGSGPLSEKFDNGTIIFGEEELLPAPSVKEGAKNPLLRFIPITMKKQFREKLSQESVEAGEMPRIFNSLQEVEDAGLTTRWVGNTRPDNFAEPSARCLFLIERPENSEHPGFALEFDGKQFAVAVYYAAGGAFNASAKIIMNVALTSLRVPILIDGKPKLSPTGQIEKSVLLWKNVWTMAFKKVPAGQYLVWRPEVKLTKDETSPAIREYIDRVVNGEADAANVEE